MNNKLIKRFATCSKDCYGSCAFTGIWDDNAPENKLISTIPSKTHPFTQGFFCAKLNKREELLYHPSRIKHALVRAGPKGKNDFKAISIDNALNLIANKLKEVIKKFDSSSIVVAFYAGNYGLIARYSPLRFFGKIGATIPYGGICNEAGCAALKEMFGTHSLTNPLQLVNAKCKLIVIWNSNLPERNIHAFKLVKDAKKNGVKIIVIDPRKHSLAKLADIHLQPFPGGEILIAGIFITEIIKRNIQDSEFLMKHVVGMERVFDLVNLFNEERAIKLSGVRKSEINELIKLLEKNKHETMFNIGFGAQKYYNGSDTIKLIALIQILLGNIGKPGTGIIYDQGELNDTFSLPIKKYIKHFDKSELNYKFPLINLGKELINEKYKILFVYGMNPASSLPNQELVRKSLSRKDLFVVVHDLFLNETTKFADVVIPAKDSLECNDIITPYYIPSISIIEGGPCSYKDPLSNYEFYRELAIRLGFDNDLLFNETQEQIFNKCISLLPHKIQNQLKEVGFYLIYNDEEVPFKNLKFPTKNGKINLNCLPKFKDIELHFDYLKINKINQFFLISPSHERFIHSQLGDLNPEHEEIFRTVFLNEKDIKKLKLTKGETVLVRNENGSFEFIVNELNDLKPTVALIYSGAPFPETTEYNVNFLTPRDPERTNLSGSYHSTKIYIDRIED
ncbi:MAG: molybdopterin-dependent oxidoreductase [Promethearchaeota archaeon]